MLLKNIKTSIESIADFEEKELILKRVELLQKEIYKLNQKYQKANKDRLAAAHILTKVNEELEESLNNEKRFIASVSHELRTPLTAIMGYSELLEDTTLTNRQQRYLGSIVQSSQHLLSLVSDLLDVAKLGDNRVELSPKRIDLDDVLNDCANLIQSKVSKGVNFIVDIPMMEYKVKADDKRIKQIFINLLSNAAKFTHKGTIRFYIKELEELENGKLKIIVNVDDTGEGISDEVAKRLFEPFQSTDKTQGTGLGLFISQQFASMMNGNINFLSKKGKGSRFSVTLTLDRCSKNEIGKALKSTNIMMFAKKSELVEKISKEFINLGVNFQNHDITSQDVTSSLVHMVASGRFLNVAIFDVDTFESKTCSIAGTLKVINPDIKLIALVGNQVDSALDSFDKALNKPISYQRLIKEVEEIYAYKLHGSKEEKDFSKLHILIVEDVELNREYEKEMLETFFGIKCDTAENGKVAVQKAKEKRYDAILMDMRMPIMDGLEATRTIRKFDKVTPIICMSANVYKEDKIAAEESGMNDFIEKPLERIDIESKLLKLVNQIFEVQKREVDLRETALIHLKRNFNSQTSSRLLNKALVSIKEYVMRVESHYDANNTKLLIEDFHALRGVLSNLGVEDLANQASQLQKLSSDGDISLIVEPKKEFMQDLARLL
ncbi:MAG: response regulator [Epsilonproteobacteria bacterium]|nr:response regulator [Campylobacterota bacterium]